MIAHIYKRKRLVDGKTEAGRSYYARIRLDGDFAVTQVSLNTSDKQVAERKLAELVREKERERAGILPPKLQRDAAQKLLSAHLADFIADLASLKRSDKYRYHIKARVTRVIGECSWKLPGDVSVDGFVAWRSKQTISPKTVNEYLNATNALLNWMVRQGRIERNPIGKTTKADVRGKQQRRRAFTDEELSKFLGVAGKRYLLYLTAAYTGLRLGELRELVWDDLQLDHKRPHLVLRASTTKNRKEATLPIHSGLLKELRKAKPEGVSASALVFGGCHHAVAARHVVKDLAKAKIARVDPMGRKLTFHSLRYTFATKLAQCKAPPGLGKSDKGLRKPRFSQRS